MKCPQVSDFICINVYTGVGTCLLLYNILFAALPVMSQQHSFQLKGTIRTGIPSNETKLLGSVYENSVYYIERSITSSQTKLFKADIAKRKASALSISFPKGLTELNARSIAVFADKFCIVNKDSAWFFHIDHTKQRCTFLRSVKTPGGYDGVMAFSNDRFVFIRLYNYHPADAPNKLGLTLYSFTRQAFTGSFVCSYKGIAYSHLVHKWAAWSTNKLFVAGTVENKVWVFDTNLVLIDTIETGMVNAINANDMMPAKEGINQLMLADSAATRIEKIFTIGDSALLISFIYPGAYKEYRKLSFYTFNGKVWTLADSCTHHNTPLPDDWVSDTNLPLNFTYSMFIDFVGPQVVTADNLDYLPARRIAYTGHLTAREKYYEHKEPKYVLRIYEPQGFNLR